MVAILIIPVVTAFICYVLRNARLIGYASLVGTAALALCAYPTVTASISTPVADLGGALSMDALSGYIMAIVICLSLASAIYSISYLEHELEAGLIDLRGVRRYYGLLQLFIFTMLIVTMANNLAIMWIGIEATTIVSALLIGLGFHKRPLAVEAAWKYIILCTVGITFALLGTFIAYYASTAVMGTEGALNWTALKTVAPRLNPVTMKLAFIFVLVGYGTKAGLAPVHNWLPDAHSQAPSPISALLSGILLNTAFYGIMRFVSIVGPSTGEAFTGNLLIIFGLISVGIAAIFILVQENYKRLLAYSSIEHMGIISLGIGIGGPVGIYGALLHILNHALSKPLMFFASGKIQARFGSTNIANVNGVLSSMPLLGTLTFIGALSLSGTPPFNIFVSEFTVLKAGVDRGLWPIVILFLLFVVIVFYGFLSGFGRMLFGKPEEASGLPAEDHHVGTYNAGNALSNGIMIVMALAVIVMGLKVPGFIDSTIRTCVQVLGVN
ncbi:MAG TPA: proton-conducting transporter membrane subunit [Nitrospirota bacterium]|nr:proton-conducting transporter membrane subunit [Nitrospirota bacterium]